MGRQLLGRNKKYNILVVEPNNIYFLAKIFVSVYAQSMLATIFYFE
jgi:hypothetical protein